MNAERLEPILSRADQVLGQVAGSFRQRMAPILPSVWESEVEDLRIDLRTWIRGACREPDGWVPIHFDYTFGLAGGEDRDRDSNPGEAVIADGMRLRGSIDLVEMHTAHRVLRITDHKTGKAREPVPQSVGQGETLQPLLYSLAVQELLGVPVVGGRLHYCTQRGKFQVHRIRLDREGRNRIGEVLETIDQAVGVGFLPAAPRAESCATCDYRARLRPLRRAPGRPQGEPPPGTDPTDPESSLSVSVSMNALMNALNVTVPIENVTVPMKNALSP